MFITIWSKFYKMRIDEIPQYASDGIGRLKRRYLSGEWHEVYSLVEFISEEFKHLPFISYFEEEVNQTLTREMSGYRLISKNIVPIISGQEIESIETAVKNPQFN